MVGLFKTGCVCLVAVLSGVQAKEAKEVVKEFLAGKGCAINVGNAITSLVEASSHMYAGVKSCEKAAGPIVDPKAHQLENWHCTADIFHVISAVAEISEYTVNIFGECFDLEAPHTECIDHGLSIAGEIADLVASVSEVKTACFDKEGPRPEAKKVTKATCVVDIKRATSFALKTMEVATQIKEVCDHSRTACTVGIFRGIGSIAGVAEYTTAAFGDCSSDIPMNTRCGKNIASLVKSLAMIAAKSGTVKDACSNYTKYHPSEDFASSVIKGFEGGWDKSVGGMLGKGTNGKKIIKSKKLTTLIKALPKNQKYDARDNVPQASTPSLASVTNTVLLAAIPVALALGFFGGRRSRTARVTTLPEADQQNLMTQTDNEFN